MPELEKRSVRGQSFIRKSSLGMRHNTFHVNTLAQTNAHSDRSPDPHKQQHLNVSPNPNPHTRYSFNDAAGDQQPKKISSRVITEEKKSEEDDNTDKGKTLHY